MTRRFNTTRRLTSAALALALGVALAPPVCGLTGRDASVGNEGELFVIREGLFGDLFPGQGLAAPENVALALDWTDPDGTSERLLVPGTETSDVEDSASVLFEDRSDTLFVLWQTKMNVIHSRLNLIGFREGEWTDPVEVSGNPFGWKSSPQLAVSRDTYHTPTEEEGLRSWNRTVVHLLWWEEGPSGAPRPHYSPVTFLDGEYTGWNPVHALDELVPSSVLGEPAPPPVDLAVAQVPEIATGRDQQSVVFGFVSPTSGELVTLAVDLIPGEVTFIADKIRAQIIDLGREVPPSRQETLASKVKAEVQDLGTSLGLHPGLTRFLADQAEEEIAAVAPDEPVSNMAERIRAQIIDLGAQMTEGAFDRLHSKSGPSVLEPASRGSALEFSGGLHMRFSVASVKPTPATGHEDVALHLAPNGREALVSWVQDGTVHYRESYGREWSTPRPIDFGAKLELARVREVLDRRAAVRGFD